MFVIEITVLVLVLEFVVFKFDYCSWCVCKENGLLVLFVCVLWFFLWVCMGFERVVE